MKFTATGLLAAAALLASLSLDTLAQGLPDTGDTPTAQDGQQVEPGAARGRVDRGRRGARRAGLESRRPDAERRIESLDSDGDEQLSLEEYNAPGLERSDRLFRMLDRDDNGLIHLASEGQRR